MKLDDPLLLARAERSRELTLEGLGLQHAGRLDEAHGRFMLALAANPADQAALYSIAAVESTRGHPAQALRHADRLVELYPDFALGHLARSQLLSVVGRMPEALQAVERALSIDPQLAGAADHRSRLQVALGQSSSQTAALPDPIAQLCLEGLNAQHAGRFDEARQCFERVLAADPANYVALYSLGLMAVNSGTADLARDLLGRAIAAHPDKPAPRVARATALGAVGLYDDAIADLDAAIAVDPMCKEAYNNKATILHTLHRKRDAMLTLQAAYERFPTDERVLGNLGYLLTEFNEHTKAAQIFTDLLKQQPEYDYAKGLRFYAKLHACDWTNYEDERQEIIADVRAGKRVINPLAFLALSDDPADIRKCAEMFGAHKYPESPNPLWRGEKYHHRRKRVAFLSADFREHPVGYLLIGVIEQLAKKQIESIGVMVGPRDSSTLYTRYRNAFDHYWDAADKTSSEIARMLRAFEVDVLIDLSGYTAGTRLEVLAERVAPVQMTYLGYPGTLGVPYVDYLIADRVVIPEESRQFYSEEVLYLPGCYLPRDKIEVPQSLTPSRESVGLEKFDSVYCAFNHEYKITPTVFQEWMERLREQPGSALWLRNHNAMAKANLAREAERYGVSGDRLVFAVRTPRIEDHLARFRLAEEFWDTFPYGGHTTASDCSIFSIPIRTHSGKAFQSRVANSIRQNAPTPQTALQRAWIESIRTPLADNKSTPENNSQSNLAISATKSQSPDSLFTQDRDSSTIIKRLSRTGRIAIVCDHLIENCVGGAQYVNSLIYKELKHRGHDVNLFEINPNTKEFERLLTSKPDALILGGINQFNYNQLEWLATTHIPYVIYQHDIPSFLYLTEITPAALIFKRITERSNGTIYISELQKKVHQTKVIASNTVVIPPPAVFDGFLDYGTQRSGLLYLGPINRARGVEEASNYAITNHPNQQLTIVGRIESEELAHKLRQRGHRIQGEVPREEVPRLLNHFEHFIYYPQIIDSFCLKIIEAELCGIEIHTNQARIGRYSYPEPTDQLRHRMQEIALSEVIDFIYKSFQ